MKDFPRDEKSYFNSRLMSLCVFLLSFLNRVFTVLGLGLPQSGRNHGSASHGGGRLDGRENMGQAKKVLADLAIGKSRAIDPADEDLHSPNREDLNWAETSWWAFANADGDIGGWFYLLTRRNLGVASLGIYIWDGTSANPWDFPYSKHFQHIPLAADFSLLNGSFPEIGAALGVREPLRSYWLRYSDTPHLEFELDFEALVMPQPIGVGESTGHLDQLLWAKGELRFEGRQVRIDGPACRDRTWSTRPEANAGQYNSYAWGATRNGGFHAMMLETPEGQLLFSAGFIWRDGAVVPIEKVKRTVEARGPDGHAIRVRMEMTDREGRVVNLVGSSRSTAALEAFTGSLCWCSVMDWQAEDGPIYRGEDHEGWPHTLLRQARLTGKLPGLGEL
ncbi:hypothetical protein Q4610_10380 [Sphingobium sp. HBC34]|uniref:AttH domain-containing protein n=1 Tax=Sphingobium cyanobacteriorum TaxID=3063954 RepID=A0ABT8ZNW8_9SPHN|nr:hypothetical protein [Sphingobium sp. HBC34]MDO7835450.1 hypothetical protein [Sphingobium sp. HBC34]